MVRLIPLVALAVLYVVLIVVFIVRPLGPKRVARFVARQRLHLDRDNADLVVSALAVSHVWRRFGVVVGVAVGGFVAVLASAHTFNFVWVFVGWFAGAVVGEWRISAPVTDPARRTAEITPRSLARYVTRTNRAIVVIFASLFVLSAVAAGYAVLIGGDGAVGGWALWLAGSLLIAGLLWLTTRRVVHRRGSLPTESLRQADDALRAQALAVLAGSSIAVSSIATSQFIDQIRTAYAAAEDGPWSAVAVLLTLASLVVGWYVASRSASGRAMAPDRVGSAAERAA